MPILIPPGDVTPTGTLLWQWVDPQGITRDLSGNASVNVLRGERGLGLPEVDLTIDKLPFTSGGIVRHAANGPRPIMLPILLSADTGAEVQELADEVYGWFATADELARTPGYLRVTRRDGTVRQIACYYKGGLEGDLNPDTSTDLVQEHTLHLIAPDPWPTGVIEEEAEYDQSDIGVVQGIVNDGEVHAYPIWTIDGPATNIVLTNTTTGKYISLTANGGVSIPSGGWITIDSRPSSQRSTLPIINSAGASLYSKVAVNSAPWWLVAGANNFSIAATGTSGATRFTMRWLPRYRGILR